MKPRRVLSLDGGGTWALIQVKALIDLYGEQTKGRAVLRNFDLVAANSGGSLVAAGLIEDLALGALLGMFLDEGWRRIIFAELRWYEKLDPRRLIMPAPRFSAARKREGLRAALPQHGGTKLDALDLSGRNGEPVRFLFSAYDYQRDRARFLRSWPSLAGGYKPPFAALTLADAVHASTNAPIKYFDAPAQIEGSSCWDGALSGYNNPVLAAAVEALALGWRREDIAILSMGTGSTMLPLSGRADCGALLKAMEEPSLVGDIEKATTTIIADPPDAHSFIAHLMLGGPLPTASECPSEATSIVRMNPLIQPLGDESSGWQLPPGLGCDEFAKLVALDIAAIEQEDAGLIARFAELWIGGVVRNQPVRGNRALECEIGFPDYAGARAAWQDLTED